MLVSVLAVFNVRIFFRGLILFNSEENRKNKINSKGYIACVSRKLFGVDNVWP